MSPLNRARIGCAYDLGEFTVRQEQLDAYAAVAGGPTPIFGIVPVWHGIRMINGDPQLGVDIGRVVHGEQRMMFLRPLRAGDLLRSVGSVASIEDRGASEVLVMRFDTTDRSGATLLTQDVVAVSRGTVAAAQARTLPKPPPAPPPTEPNATRSFHLDQDVSYRYAEASGDDNLIHTDPEFARKVGLPGIIVQGMCLLHVATRAVMDELGAVSDDVASVHVRFSSMMLPGRDLCTRIWREERGARFESVDPEGKAVLRQGRVRLH